MNDDFSTPSLIANIFEAVKFINSVSDGNASITTEDLEILKTEILSFTMDVLGLKLAKSDKTGPIDAIMDLVLEIRKNARENKDWTTSDIIRDKLTQAGVEVKDGKEGVTWSIK
jgi:cysteinyl-tRNA synthetase